MIGKILSIGLQGLKSYLIDIEADINRGLPSFNIVGLADKAILEARQRVFSAIRNSGFEMPYSRIIINMAPADIAKNGPVYDLPIALAILKASGQINACLESCVFWGELSLNGDTRFSKGALVAADGVKNLGMNTIVLPEINANEAGIVAGINILPLRNLAQLRNISAVNSLNNAKKYEMHIDNQKKEIIPGNDFTFIKGQYQAKRVFEISAVGKHNLLLVGPPGSGKTFISRTFPTILPPMSFKETMEVTKIYSISGLLGDRSHISCRPFRSPHHTASHIALIGGGQNPRPGEITLAHKGVLFMDEFNEFSNRSLECLRQPLEQRNIQIARASGSVSFPADFILVAAMNPCRCGYHGDPDRICTCSKNDLTRFQNRISGPILDRFDMRLFMPRVAKEDLLSTKFVSEASSVIRERVQNAEHYELGRSKKLFGKFLFNSELSAVELQQSMVITPKIKKFLSMAIDKEKLSARSYFKILRVARTIADLESSEKMKVDHFIEALEYRNI